jgi:sortase A
MAVTDTPSGRDVDKTGPTAPGPGSAGARLSPGLAASAGGTPSGDAGPPAKDAAPDRKSRGVEAIAAQVLLALGVLLAGFLLFVFVLSSLTESRAQAGLQRRFERPLVDGRAPIAARIRYGTPVARLDIPTAGVHQIVVEGTTPVELERGPGHVAVTPLPGEVGNAVIAGHRIAFGGPFSGLSRLATGATIDVLTGQGRFTYVVASRHVLAAHDVAPFQATSDNRLTLVTADNLGGTSRLVVVAELHGRAKPFARGRPTTMAVADGGLVGQSSDLGGLLFWSLALVAVAVASVLMYRRMPRWSGYLATTPVIVLVAWLVYENLARVLPATF